MFRPFACLSTLALIAGCATSAPSGQPAPIARPTAPVSAASPAARPAEAPAGFAAWRENFRRTARANGISDAIYDAALGGARPNEKVLRADAYQPEFTKPIWEYLDSAVSETRVARGRELYAARRADLARIEQAYGVDAKVVMAIWGGESNFGTIMGDYSVPEALATLAYEGRRRSFGESQLIAALKILQAGDISPERMRGSWAGAMGHTQFIPTTFLEKAVDFTGDGRRDLWAPDALDALASTAHYLAQAGWRRGAPWGAEVSVPQGFNYALADGKARPVSFWRAQGVRGLGGAIPEAGGAKLLMPAGARGPAFLTFANFDAVKRYNNADAYSLAINHLADRIAGGGPLRADWPRGEPRMARGAAEEIQRRLTALGFDTQGTDGILGPNSRAAIRAYQVSRGLTPDGHANAALLQKLRAERGG